MFLSLGMNAWWLVAFIAAAAAAAVWLYGVTTPSLSRSKRTILTLLRFGALALILFLLLEPVLRLVERREQQPLVSVLVDDSESLRLTASADSSASSVRARVQELLQGLPSAARNADVRFLTFGSDLREGYVPRFEADSLRFEASRTDIAGALESLRERLRGDNLRAVVLVSDGRYNTGRNPLHVSERYPVPIFPVVVGDTSSRRDVQVRRVTTNDLAHAGVELPVQVGIWAEGVEDEEVTVSLVEEGTVVSSRRVALGPGRIEIPVDLSVTPEATGLHRYTVAITPLPGEATHLNNQQSLVVRVLDSRRRVLLVAAAPGPDLATVRRFLESDQAFEVTPFVQKDSLNFYEGSFPASLDEFDAIVLVGYPGQVADEAVLRRLATAAMGGTPAFFMITSETDLSRLQSAFSGALPAVPDQIRSTFFEASFQPLPNAGGHSVMNVPDAEPEGWLRLPPLTHSLARWIPSPDAQVLATTVVRGVVLETPLFIVRNRAQRRTAALLGAGTWKWGTLPEDLSDLDALWPTLFSNTMRWLTASRDDRPVRVSPLRDAFDGTESIRFFGQVYDESLEPVPDAFVEVHLTAPDQTAFTYVMSPIGHGRYTLDAGSLPEGTYRYTAAASRRQTSLGEDSGQFVVGSLTLEYRETWADAELMYQLARRSGGVVPDVNRPDSFREALAPAIDATPVAIERAVEADLRRHSAFLLVIVMLLASEWFIRKRSGMV